MKRTPTPVPSAARWLGAGGLAVFVGLAVWRINSPLDTGFIHMVLVACAAIILTFIGALHWGFAMVLPRTGRRDQWLMMGWSIFPALAGWAAMLLPVYTDIILLLAVFWVHYTIDVHLALRRPLPTWYLPLRSVLTLGITLALLAVLALTPRGAAMPSNWQPDTPATQPPVWRSL